MIQRIDLSDQDLQRYPQYFRDKYFIPKATGRFIRWTPELEMILNVYEESRSKKIDHIAAD